MVFANTKDAMIEALVKEAFAKFGLSPEEGMSQEEFSQWILRHPPAVQFLDVIKRAG